MRSAEPQPNEMVEAAARVIWSAGTSESWDERLAQFPKSWDIAKAIHTARAALAAALSLLPSEVEIRADERKQTLHEARLAVHVIRFNAKPPDIFYNGVRASEAELAKMGALLDLPGHRCAPVEPQPTEEER